MKKIMVVEDVQSGYRFTFYRNGSQVASMDVFFIGDLAVTENEEWDYSLTSADKGIYRGLAEKTALTLEE